MSKSNIEKGMAQISLYDGEVKCRIESEGILPDWCPDIKRIIKVDVDPKIISKRRYIEGNNIICEVEGNAAFNVVYMGGDNDRIANYIFYSDFGHNFKLPSSQNDEYENICALCSVYSENINCKPQSPRKISLRSDVNVAMSLSANKTFQYYTSEEDIALKKVEVKAKATDVCMIASVHDAEFTVSDTLKLPNEYPQIGDIVDYDAKITCDSAKIVSDKIQLRATAAISFAYRSDSASQEKYISLCQPIEISQYIETEDINLSEDSIPDIRLSADTLNFDTDVDDDGETKIIKFDLNCSACVKVIKNLSCNLIVDAYGINADTIFETDEADFYSLVSNTYDNFSLREKLADIKTESAESVKARIDHRSFVMENGQLFSMSKLYINMICISRDGELEHIRKNIDVRIPLSLSEDLLSEYERGNVKIEFICNVKSIDCRKSDNGMDIFADIGESLLVFAKPGINYIKEMEILPEDTAREGMIFYYPSEDDTIWNIGKKYKVSQEELIKENSISDGKLPAIIMIK